MAVDHFDCGGVGGGVAGRVRAAVTRTLARTRAHRKARIDGRVQLSDSPGILLKDGNLRIWRVMRMSTSIWHKLLFFLHFLYSPDRDSLRQFRIKLLHYDSFDV